MTQGLPSSTTSTRLVSTAPITIVNQQMNLVVWTCNTLNLSLICLPVSRRGIQQTGSKEAS
jgi:hypothetical protein